MMVLTFTIDKEKVSLKQIFMSCVNSVSKNYNEKICEEFFTMVCNELSTDMENGNLLLKRTVYESRLGIDDKGSKQLDIVIRNIFVDTDIRTKLCSEIQSSIMKDIDADIMRHFYAVK